MKLFRTWGSGIGMLPSGGTAAWGNATWAPDDTPEMIARNLTYGCANPSAGCANYAQAHHLRLTFEALQEAFLFSHDNLAPDKNSDMGTRNFVYQHSPAAA